MSIQSRITRGIGFGALSVAMLGFAPTTITPELHGGRPAFIPVKVGKTAVKPSVLYANLVKTTATGSKNTLRVLGNARAIPLSRLVVRKTLGNALGCAVCDVKVVGLHPNAGLCDISAAAGTEASVFELKVCAEPCEVSAGGVGTTDFQQTWIKNTQLTASGIQNLSEEEIILLYRSLRVRRDLRTREIHGTKRT